MAIDQYLEQVEVQTHQPYPSRVKLLQWAAGHDDDWQAQYYHAHKTSHLGSCGDDGDGGVEEKMYVLVGMSMLAEKGLE